jgi:hypothetical protein
MINLIPPSSLLQSLVEFPLRSKIINTGFSKAQKVRVIYLLRDLILSRGSGFLYHLRLSKFSINSKAPCDDNIPLEQPLQLVLEALQLSQPA